MAKPYIEWMSYSRAAEKAGVGNGLLQAVEAAKHELRDRARGLRDGGRKLTQLAREHVIQTAKNKPSGVPKTWGELANLRESAILTWAVDDAIDAHHAAHPEDGCGRE